MLGPLSQRLGQALAEQAASMQALHARVESVASGTQAALATPLQVDEAGVAALEPRLAAIVTEIASLRAEVASMPAGSATIDVDALRDQIASLVGSAAPRTVSLDGSDASIALTQDIDVALRRTETRITAHVDDAVLALAQTLLGQNHSAPAVPSYDEDVEAGPISVGWPAHADQDTAYADQDTAYADRDTAYADQGHDAGGYDESPEVAQIDFSAVQFADEAPEPVSWSAPAPAYGSGEPSPFAAQAQAAIDQPFDQESEAAWAAQAARPVDGPQTVVPDRRRRWFSK
jgi:hypothetical protein